jgi:hypothetical protein
MCLLVLDLLLTTGRKYDLELSAGNAVFGNDRGGNEASTCALFGRVIARLQ